MIKANIFDVNHVLTHTVEFSGVELAVGLFLGALVAYTFFSMWRRI